MERAPQTPDRRLSDGVLPRLDRVDLGEDRLGEPVEELRCREGILVGRNLQLAVTDPRQGERIQEPAEDPVLPHEDHLVDRVVFPVGLARPPVHPACRHELVVELWREGEGLGREHLLLEERERVALLLGLDDPEWRGGVGIPLVGPRGVKTADESGGEVHRVAMRCQEDAECLADTLVAGHLAAGILGRHSLDERRHHLGDELGPVAGELDRITAEIEAVRHRIGVARLGVFVG